MKNRAIWWIVVCFTLSSLYFIVVEFISVICSQSGMMAYFNNTISSLSVPYKISNFSKVYWLMTSTYFVNALLCFVGYYNLTNIFVTKNKVIIRFLFCLFCFSLILIGSFHSMGNFVALHLTGATVCFLSGNLLLIVLGLTLNASKWLKITIVIFGCFGLASTLLMPLINTTFLFPIFERCSIYPIIFAQIAISANVWNCNLMALNCTKLLENSIK